MDKEEFQKAIGKRIKYLRTGQNMSQAELAALCNFEKSNMNRIESGKTNPSSYTLYKISKHLQVKLSDITSVIN
ncbi:helix-turn-helix transcriptional regulator [Elizabethkingia anophelis]|nr:helix-turn-helix transcriptional regulator [Elizabethkingia anophelis]MCT3952373.1 helix-turn-helix transcriptional regulator [Elizabethkingia anophelis]MCT3955916.1 helix-turn-helix transcriptional regulator [Elizabethkingia anophelis]MCT3987606.1 helix-turn-helix transcriptional regulator [Elizabethkingia anophelis]MCT4066154.1 helix-turn-helix transcriptional regulator [Elizabethkingia anophelis]